MKSRHVAIALAIAAAAFLLGQAVAQEEGAAPPQPEWTKPTKWHEEMKQSVGWWNVEAEMWMAPGAPPQKFSGVAERKMILNGMYLKEIFRCEWEGEQFEGHLIQGYDTVRKEWVNIWIDSGSPVPHINRGKAQEGVTTFVGEGVDYMTGKVKKTKSTVKNDNPDQVTFAMYDVGPDGSDVMRMRMVYKRKK